MEIERRFLVDGRTEKPWRSEAKSIHNIEQYYLQASNLTLDQDGNLCLSDVIMTRPSKEEIVVFESEPDWIPRIRIKDGVSIRNNSNDWINYDCRGCCCCIRVTMGTISKC